MKRLKRVSFHLRLSADLFNELDGHRRNLEDEKGVPVSINSFLGFVLKEYATERSDRKSFQSSLLRRER